MKCVICGGEAGYNRAAIDLYSGTELGHLCMNCEKDEFGNTFTYGDANDDITCRLCRRDGQISFPRYEPVTEIREDGIVVKSVIEEGNAPCLCDEHFHTIADTADRKRVIER